MFSALDRNSRITTCNYAILGIVVFYTILAQRFTIARPLLGTYFDPVFVFLTSIGFYNILTRFVITFIENVDPVLRLYWGRSYVHGLWSYTYTIDGVPEEERKTFFGVWRFEQDLFETKVIGFGLTDDFRVRSRVRSVSDLTRNGEMYEVVNIRSDEVSSSVDNYSRTSMFFELDRNRFLKTPHKIRGKTVVFGGAYSGRVYNTIFTRHPEAKTEEDVIAFLQRSFPIRSKGGRRGAVSRK